MPIYTGDLWWFVRDVNGIERTVTAATFIFDQRRERTFPFDLVEPLTPLDFSDENEAAAVRGAPRATVASQTPTRGACRVGETMS